MTIMSNTVSDIHTPWCVDHDIDGSCAGEIYGGDGEGGATAFNKREAQHVREGFVVAEAPGGRLELTEQQALTLMRALGETLAEGRGWEPSQPLDPWIAERLAGQPERLRAAAAARGCPSWCVDHDGSDEPIARGVHHSRVLDVGRLLLHASGVADGSEPLEVFLETGGVGLTLDQAVEAAGKLLTLVAEVRSGG